MKFAKKCLILSLFIALAGAVPAYAAVMNADNAYSTCNYIDTTPENTINGSGLDGIGNIEDQTHDNHVYGQTMWLTGDVIGALGSPSGAPVDPATQAVAYSFLADIELSGLYIWNYNQPGCLTRGVNDFELLVSPDADPVTASWTSAGSYSLAIAGGVMGEPSQYLSLGTTLSGIRSVMIDVTTNHGDAGWTGISEVRFDAIPEPTTMALLGMGSLVLLRKKRS